MLHLGQDRNQLQMLSLESLITPDNGVRVVDAFVDSLDLKSLGFIIKGQIRNGAPAFGCSTLLKLYYYGYLNRVRSSRRLEREAKTNIEAMWLVKGLSPSYKTIADFRKENKKALKQAFYSLNRFLKGEGLFDDQTVAIDGSRFHGQNSKKHNYNTRKVKRHLDYIAIKVENYLKELEELDQLDEQSESSQESRLEVSQRLDELTNRKNKYKELEGHLTEGELDGQHQISTIDEDARALVKKNSAVVGYNVLASGDKKNKLITNFEVSNQPDTNALSDMAVSARQVLEKKEGQILQVLADKGFETGRELKKCQDNDIETFVAPKSKINKTKGVGKEQFEYLESSDHYRCPQGYLMVRSATWSSKRNGKHNATYRVRRHRMNFKKCQSCPLQEDCLSPSNLKYKKGRTIERSEYEPYIEQNAERVKLNKSLYAQRQAIIEHPFGTIKRQWGYSYTLLKGKQKVEAEFGIIFTVYNLRRAISILGAQQLIKRLINAYLIPKAFVLAILSTFELFYNQTQNGDSIKNLNENLFIDRLRALQAYSIRQQMSFFTV